MPTQEEIQNQLSLLETHRRTLAVYLRQRAQMSVLAPPGVAHGIDEARKQIGRTKDALRQWGAAVDDHPDDTESAPDHASVASRPRKQLNPQILVALIAAAATIIAALIGLMKLNGTDSSSSERSFQYQVRVQDKDTSNNLPNAKVTIEMADIAPLDTFTDNNGYTRMMIDSHRVGRPARIIVETKGYQRYEQAIDLTPGALPDVIKLEAIP
ncbi:MAG: hypothetical protein IPP13_03240 [Kouleothrix sp.]|jgi:hypothetical protein|nr:hypothetical protein [Kouleothrix sp.]